MNWPYLLAALLGIALLTFATALLKVRLINRPRRRAPGRRRAPWAKEVLHLTDVGGTPEPDEYHPRRVLGELS
jgi:hypothetical protein